MNLFWFLSVTLTVALPLASSAGNNGKKPIICYYGTWATYRPGDGQFNVEDVNTDICTHVIYTFVGIVAEGYVISLDPWLDLPDDGGRDNLRKFTALKERNPDLQTILAVGGWNEGSANYSIMAGNEAYRKNFISSALDFVQTYGFDGFDIDWEYPNRRDTVNGEADIDNFSLLVKEIKEEFSKYGLSVSAAVSAVEEAAVQSYDVPVICEYLDFVHVMTYDMYGPADNFTGLNAALHLGEAGLVNTVDVAIEYWLSAGCPAEKVIMGLPFYGKTYNLVDPEQNGVGAPSNGPAPAGPITQENGTLAYSEICLLLQDETWNVNFEPLARVPYASRGNVWISYDNPQSITEKVNWALEKNIGGVMFWSIESDDFHGNCGEKFPLLNAINDAINNYKPAKRNCKKTCKKSKKNH
ncbi:glycosyl hydrolases family 18 domain-containing protein [Phthorimaea operculella]|nr:glycosyl hydrolases family 18 domain-containing protein [Phthorimaea operculella]